MSFLDSAALLLAWDAAETAGTAAWHETRLGLAAIVLLVFLVPYLLGNYLAGVLRMRDYAWKLTLILLAGTAAFAINVLGWPPNLGIDLKGGTILTYEIDRESVGDKEVRIDELVAAVRNRVDPSGVRQITVRSTGDNQVEFIIPEVDTEQVESIKRIVAQTGALEFRILADPRYPQDVPIIEQARATAENLVKESDVLAERDHEQHRGIIPEARNLPLSERVYELEGRPLARWDWVDEQDRERIAASPDYVTRVDEQGDLQVLMIVQQPRAMWVNVGTDDQGELRIQPESNNISRTRNNRLQLLVLMDRLNVTGEFLASARRDFDQRNQPAVAFTFDSAGASRFAVLTRDNVPDPATGFRRHLGIVLDGNLLSAPTINSVIRDRGQITGNFTQAEVDWLVGVLDAGSLPAALTEEPTSEQSISATLGQDTIDAGARAIAISFLVVLLFMPLYYRFAGLVASIALTATLVLVVAAMITISAAFTLPGLAGLVLTVGMAVDANVLIFERIREELTRGAALRMAIRNGFDRATRTIVDANVTTLIVAMVLWTIGTDLIKGFAVTLILGILMSMFTAIFCSRVVFEIAERRRWLKSLSMMRLLGETNINFLNKKVYCIAASLALIAVGMATVVSRGREMLDIEFVGGTAAQAMFVSEQQTADVRSALAEFPDELPDLRVVEVGGENTQFLIETTNQDIQQVRQIISREFGDLLLRNHVRYDAAEFETITRESLRGGADPAGPSGSEGPEGAEGDPAETPADESPAEDTPADEAPADEIPAEETPADEPPADDLPEPDLPAEEPATPEQPATPEVTGEPSDDEEVVPIDFPELLGGTRATIRFDLPLDQESVARRVEEALQGAVISPPPPYRVSRPGLAEGSLLRFEDWTLEIRLSAEETEQLLAELERQVAAAPMFASVSNIGAQVAGDAQRLAIVALLVSLLGIVAYIWIRFQRVVFGLAAVVALVHDVLITLGVLAICGLIAETAGMAWLTVPLQLENFKISLTILAGLLTIIGYSLNDTIVVFDRIREVRGKSPRLTEQMVNDSVNQMLGRTLLTSLTTLAVVLILYFFGGPGIHGFAFSLVIGVLVGTYSSIYIASPALLWMSGRDRSQPSEVDRLAGKVEPTAAN